MKKNEDITAVVFRKFKEDGEIIALFPYELWNRQYDITSYMHVGQHGGADYTAIISRSTLATEEEYKDLKNELENNFDYHLKVLKKCNAQKVQQAYKNNKG